MQEATIGIPLRAPNEKSPRTGGPVGQLRKLTNGVVKKIRDDGTFRVEKRPGYFSLAQSIYSVQTAALITSGGITAPQYLGTNGDELLAIGNDGTLNAYSAAKSQWRRLTRTASTASMFKTVARVGPAAAVDIDDASIGNIVLRTWSEAGNSYWDVVDIGTKTPLRQPAIFTSGTNARAKVVADGTRFWVFWDGGTTTVTVFAVDTSGALLGTSATATTLPAIGYPWDVMAMPGTGNGAVVARRTGTSTPTVTLGFCTWTGSAIATSSAVNSDVPCSYGLGWILNDTADTTHLYLATSTRNNSDVGVLTRGIYAVRMTTAGVTVGSIYTVVNGLSQQQADQISAITGYVISGGTDLWVTWTSQGIDSGPVSQPQNSTVNYVTTSQGGSPSVAVSKGSVSLASRAFRLGSRYLTLVYYASQVGVSLSTTPGPGQPTYFLIDITTQDLYGRLEHGTAEASWMASGWAGTSYGAYFYCLPSVYIDALSQPHLVTGFAAQLNEVRFLVADVPFYKLVPMAGIIDVVFGGASTGCEYAGELLVPGPITKTFGGPDLVTSGIELNAEPVIASGSGTSGPLASGQTYSYVAVIEGRDRNGNRVRSGASIPVSVTLTGGQTSVALVIRPVRITTHDALFVSLYRTVWDTVNNVQGTTWHKITVEVSNSSDPRSVIINDVTATTINYTDVIDNQLAAIGEELYTDDGTLDSAPPPPSSCMAVLADRVYVAGYDNRVFYSFGKTSGLALAFNEDEMFFTVPTTERIRALAAMDQRLFILCDESVWYVDDRALDSTGVGSNPTPIQIPQSKGNGCVGYAVVGFAGIYYASTQGRIMRLDRGLSIQYAGAPVEDDSVGAAFVGACADSDQRIAFYTAGGNALVYDQAVDIWYVWALPSNPTACCTYQGMQTYADSSGPLVRQARATEVADNAVTPIITTISLQGIALADITGFQVIWEAAIAGEWLGTHTLNIDVQYDESGVTDETFSQAFTSPTAPYRFTFQPKHIECSTMILTIYDSFPITPSAGFALEALGVYVGVERGVKYQDTRLAPV